MATKKSPWPPEKYADNTVKRKFKPSLHTRTLHALREVIDNKRQTLQEIADGADVQKGWLRMYALKKIPDPSVSRVEKLYHYLTGNTL